MLTDFRAGAASLVASLGLTLEDGTEVEVWDRVPDDVTSLPCVVVGLPSASPSSQGNGVVFDRSLTLYVVGRRVHAGDPEQELTTLTDMLVAGIGGTRNKRHAALHFTVQSITARVLPVAGVDHDAYAITLNSPFATC